MYDNLRYKTIDQIYKLLPINGRTKLFVDLCGKYYPERDKERIGHIFAETVADFTDQYLYIGTSSKIHRY